MHLLIARSIDMLYRFDYRRAWIWRVHNDGAYSVLEYKTNVLTIYLHVVRTERVLGAIRGVSKRVTPVLISVCECKTQMLGIEY